MANKFQPAISFRSVDALLDFLPDEELRIVEKLRALIFEVIPNVNEQLSYNVPYYAIKKKICFIWPSAVPWGGQRWSGVKLGFTRAHSMDHDGLLDMGNRKSVGELVITSEKNMDFSVLTILLLEAVRVDGL